MRLVRRPDRAQAERARRRRGDGQLRDRQAAVAFDPRVVTVDDAPRRGRGGRLPRLAGARARPRSGGDATGSACALVVAAVLTVPLVLVAMVTPLQFDGWEWVALALATPVVLWAGWPFHRAALVNARHGAATMDTLVSIGTLAAFGWSAVVVCRGTRRRHLLRGRRRDHDADPAGPLPRGARPPALGRGDPLAARARRQGRTRAARRHRGARPRRRARRRRPLRRASGREDRDRRRRRRRRVRRRPVDADR